MERLMARKYLFGDFTLDKSRFRLEQGERLLRLEKLPMELLFLLVERRGELVSREDIAEHLWGNDVFLEVDNGINTAIRKLRQALRDDPDKPRYIETVVGKGYRFAASVICSNGGSSPQVEALPSPAHAAAQLLVPSEESQPRTVRPWLFIGITAILVLLIGAAIWYRGRSLKHAAQPAIKSIAVLPLKNLSGDPSQEYLADGMTEALIGRLSRIHDLRVISRTSAMQFKDTRMSAPEIAKALHVDALVEGSVIRESGRVRVNAQLIRGATDEHFWSETYDRDLSDALALQSDVAQSIAAKVEVAVTGKEHESLTAVHSVLPEVYESYLKGRFALDKSNGRSDIDESIVYFQDAINKDPTFAPAYLGLAEAYDNLGYIFVGVPPGGVRPKMISAARKAIELDPDLAEAHVLLAETYQERWQWSDAGAEYKKALELKPNDANARFGFAKWLLCQGRIDEALAWSESGAELQPLDPDGAVGWLLFNARRYDDAIRELRSVLVVHPDSAMAHWVLGFATIGKGQFEEAISVLEKTVSMTNRSPGAVGLLATAYARAGHRTKALRLVEELKQRQQKGYVPAGAFITPYLALGDYDEAFVWLERAYQEQSTVLQFLKVDPFLDPVRSDPRFADLIRRVGLNEVR